jgi:glutamate-1-semialdehyde 2,1-aminomutase
LPVGAFGGRRDIMSELAPSGPVYQAGTLSGNPLAVTAGIVQLQALKRLNPYPQFERLSMLWANGLANAAKRHGFSLKTAACGSMLGFFFSDTRVRNFTQAKECNTELFAKFFHGMLAEGIYLAPSAFEAGFLSTEHTKTHIEYTIAAADRVFAALS